MATSIYLSYIFMYTLKIRAREGAGKSWEEGMESWETWRVETSAVDLAELTTAADDDPVGYPTTYPTIYISTYLHRYWKDVVLARTVLRVYLSR